MRVFEMPETLVMDEPLPVTLLCGFLGAAKFRTEKATWLAVPGVWCRAVSCGAVPCRAVPCRAMRAVPCRAVHRAAPRRDVPRRAVLSRAAPCRTVLCRGVALLCRACRRARGNHTNKRTQARSNHRRTQTHTRMDGQT